LLEAIVGLLEERPEEYGEKLAQKEVEEHELHEP